jgi:hypothetical protein
VLHQQGIRGLFSLAEIDEIYALTQRLVVLAPPSRPPPAGEGVGRGMAKRKNIETRSSMLQNNTAIKNKTEGGQTDNELLLSEIASAGKNSQFRQPRHIIKLIAELVEPQLGNWIADPACGTGGFLLGAYQYLVTQLDKNRHNLSIDEDGFIRNSVSSLLTRDVSDILNSSLYGYDIDVTVLAKMGLLTVQYPDYVLKIRKNMVKYFLVNFFSQSLSIFDPQLPAQQFHT